MASKSVAGAISNFGATVKSKLANTAISGAPEDQLRGPLETLIKELAETGGLAHGTVHLVGETTLNDIKTRPDFAVTVSKALVGFVEVHVPGKGADPRRYKKGHDKEQWKSSNRSPTSSILTAMRSASGRTANWSGFIVVWTGTSKPGRELARPPELAGLLEQLPSLGTHPAEVGPRTAKVSARLRRMRDEVAEQLVLDRSPAYGAAQTCGSPSSRRPITGSSPTAMPRPSLSGCSWPSGRHLLANGLDQVGRNSARPNSLIGQGPAVAHGPGDR